MSSWAEKIIALILLAGCLAALAVLEANYEQHVLETHGCVEGK